jgi:lipopolysaccharide transport system permease protein
LPGEVQVIKPRPLGTLHLIREAVARPGLFAYFGRRATMRRYARTWLGRFWLLLAPGLAVGAQVFLFGGILGIRTGVPYVIFFLVAFAAWHYFSELAYWATRSLEINRRSLRTMYVPRLTLVAASIVPSAIDYAIYLGFLAIAVAHFLVTQGDPYITLGVQTLMTLAGLALLTGFGLAIGLWLSVPALKARDVRFGLRFALRLIYFFTPVVYPLSLVPARYRGVIELNPLTYPMELVKGGLMGLPVDVPASSIVITGCSLLALLGSGLVFFTRLETVALDSA